VVKELKLRALSIYTHQDLVSTINKLQLVCYALCVSTLTVSNHTESRVHLLVYSDRPVYRLCGISLSVILSDSGERQSSAVRSVVDEAVHTRMLHTRRRTPFSDEFTHSLSKVRNRLDSLVAFFGMAAASWYAIPTFSTCPTSISSPKRSGSFLTEISVLHTLAVTLRMNRSASCLLL
jgi:hypothetical protein